MFAYTARPERFEMTARHMTTNQLEAIPQTFTNTLYRDESGRLRRGVPCTTERLKDSSLIPQSTGYHSKCAHMHKNSTLGNSLSLTSTSRRTSLRRTGKLSLPPANQKASREEREAYDTAQTDFFVESGVQSQKRTLNPHRGLTNANFGKTARVNATETKYVPSGYAGHIQNMQFIHGRTYSKIADQVLSYRDDNATPTKPNYHELL